MELEVVDSVKRWVSHPPVATPTRPFKMDGKVLFPGEKRGLNPAEITIAEMLKSQGYTTGCFGKWHLGDQPQFLPLAQGFDEYFGTPYSNDMWRPDILKKA